MKKIFSWAGLVAAAAMALVGCAEEIDQPNVDLGAGVPYELVANPVETKTVNDGMSTKWAEGDALNVFYTEAGSTEYGSNCQFTVSDVESGVFAGTLTAALDEAKSYDWYLSYPYSQHVKTPAATSGGYVYMGDSRGLKQSEYGSMAHLVGSACPLYAVVKANPATTPLDVTLQHLTSVVELCVTNNTGAPLSISKVKLTVPESGLVGSYYVDFVSTPVAYTPKDGSTYDSSEVSVTNPTELAVGESAKLYLVVKPMTIEEGKTWSISINGLQAEEKTLASAVTFKAGEIQTVNYDFKGAEEVLPTKVTVAEFLAAAEGGTIYELTGVITEVINTTYGNFYLEDETGRVYIYGLCSPTGEQKYWAESGAKVGDTITIQTVRTSHNKTPQGRDAIFVSLEPAEVEVEFTGDGLTAETAYTVEDLVKYYNASMDKTKVWVKGTIIGSMVNNKLVKEEGENASSSNLAIGTDEITVPVQLKDAARTALNLQNNAILGREVALYGTIEAYFSMAGLKNVTDYVLAEAEEPGEELEAETVIWEGTHDTAGWSGNQDLAYGGYDWSKVTAGTLLKLYVTPNDPSSDWWCISLRTAAEGWPNITGIPGQYDKPTYSITLELTQAIIDELVAGNGLIFTGSQTTVTKISLLPADAEIVLWEGEMTSTSYSNCQIGQVNDWLNNGVASGDKVKIYVTAGDTWAMMISDGQWKKWFATGEGGAQDGLYGQGFSNYNTDLTNGYIEFEMTEAMLTTLTGYTWGNLLIIQGDEITVTKISFK